VQVTFGENDVVGCSMDLDSQTLTWYKNGEAAFVGDNGLEIIQGGPIVVGADEVMRANLAGEEFDLFPSCCMYSTNVDKLAKVIFSFRARHPCSYFRIEIFVTRHARIERALFRC